MALDKIDYGTERKLLIGGGFHFPDWLGLIAIAAVQVFVLLLLIPLPLVAPVLCLLSFVMACCVTLYALSTHARRDAVGPAVWNVACTLTLIWIVAAVLSKPAHVLAWFDRL